MYVRVGGELVALGMDARNSFGVLRKLCFYVSFQQKVATVLCVLHLARFGCQPKSRKYDPFPPPPPPTNANVP